MWSIVVAPDPDIATAFRSVESRKRGREGHAFLFQDTIHCIHWFCSNGNGQNGHMASIKLLGSVMFMWFSHG